MTPEHREIVEQIHSSSAVLRRAVEASPPGKLTRTPSEGEWSALETLTHVREVVVHVYGLRIRRLLYEDDPVFADFDEDSFRRASSPPFPTPSGPGKAAIRCSAWYQSSFSPGASASTPWSTRRKSRRPTAASPTSALGVTRR